MPPHPGYTALTSETHSHGASPAHHHADATRGTHGRPVERAWQRTGAKNSTNTTPSSWSTSFLKDLAVAVVPAARAGAHTASATRATSTTLDMADGVSARHKIDGCVCVCVCGTERGGWATSRQLCALGTSFDDPMIKSHSRVPDKAQSFCLLLCPGLLDCTGT